jgi:hypothetical protein
MDEKSLIKQMLEARDSVLELVCEGNGRVARSVTVRRPDEGGMVRLRNAPTLDIAREVVVDWKGWTEADLLPEGVGGGDTVPFSRSVWAVYVGDNLAHAAAIETRIVELMRDYFERKEAAGKN